MARQAAVVRAASAALAFAAAACGAAGQETDAEGRAVLQRHARFPGCEEGQPVAFKGGLEDGKTLYAVTCETFAYNATFALYVVTRGDGGGAERLAFAEYLAELGWYGAMVLYNTTYDEGTRTLKALYKARGLGDCGASGTWRWTSLGFKLIEYRAKAECDGRSSPWPVIYRAPAR